jgi:ABC-type bacteriocin/lantibiotic exporter with double-glycine peptidase domain
MGCCGTLDRFPYLSQLNNQIDPYGSCALTSLAMCLSYMGIVGDGSKLGLPDQLRKLATASSKEKNSVETMQWLCNLKGIKSRFSETATIQEIKEHILRGKPCVVHGWFTTFGHVIAVYGFDGDSLIVADPYGEYWENGYDTETSGHGLHYSNNLITRLCADEKGIWCHFIG